MGPRQSTTRATFDKALVEVNEILTNVTESTISTKTIDQTVTVNCEDNLALDTLLINSTACLACERENPHDITEKCSALCRSCVASGISQYQVLTVNEHVTQDVAQLSKMASSAQTQIKQKAKETDTALNTFVSNLTGGSDTDTETNVRLNETLENVIDNDFFKKYLGSLSENQNITLNGGVSVGITQQVANVISSNIIQKSLEDQGLEIKESSEDEQDAESKHTDSFTASAESLGGIMGIVIIVIVLMVMAVAAFFLFKMSRKRKAAAAMAAAAANKPSEKTTINIKQAEQPTAGQQDQRQDSRAAAEPTSSGQNSSRQWR